MAVVQNTIKQALLDMTDELKALENSEEGRNKWADLLSGIIKDAILSADVAAGIPVTTSGSATTQAGATTSTGSLL
jgi:hypothetical protein